jgi:hypothetical protein
VEVLRKDNMEEEDFFPEDEEELEEVKLNVIPLENQGTSLGNVSKERKKEEGKHTLLNHKNMWKQK